MKKLFALGLGLLATNPTFAAVQLPIDCHIFFDGTNTIQIAWNAYPGKSYVLQSTTNLLGAWTNSPVLVATTTALTNSFPTAAQAQFFKVVRLDTEGPAIVELSPADGTIAAGRQSSIAVSLTDLNGINTNSLSLRVGTNAPVTLADARLSYADGQLTYAPATNEFLGDHGVLITNTVIAADALGNWSTNDWSFQLALQPIAGTNILFIGSGGQKDRGDNLTLISTNGNYFTYTYTGASSGLTNGMHLVNTNLSTGYTRTVVSFTDYPASKTVVVLTRLTKLAELLQQGSLQSASFTELNGSKEAKDAAKARLSFHYNYNLERILYQDGNLVIGLLPSSQLDLNAAFDINANFGWFKLTSFEAVFSGSADFTLEAYARVSGAYDRSGETGLITPVHKFYGTLVGGVPVWVELVFEINAGYDLHLEGSAGYTNGFNAVKTIKAGRRWDTTKGWTTIWDNPALGFSLLGPKWQVEASGNLQVYLQPKLTILVYSAAGAWVDLKPYAELEGNLQLNPYEFNLALYAGLTSTIGLDLRVWDDSWGELPNHTFDLIPRTLLWETNSTAAAPQISVPPQPTAVPTGGTATFTVQAGGTGPFSYRWQKNGLYLNDDSRITGTRSSTLRIANAQTSDAGNYRVIVSNPNGSVTSQSALLTVYSGSVPSGMAYIPAGSFTMGNCMDPSEGYSDELPLHSVYVSAFYMDKYEVTKALWDDVYNWAITHGYSFEYGAQGKANNHPAHSMTWYDAVKWCNARSEKEGRTPAYYTSAGQTTVYRSGQVDVQNGWVKWNSGYRLPTEAEWEKAARGGASGKRFPWADANTISHSRANYYAYPSGYAYDVNPTEGFHPTFNDGVSPYTSPVGYFAANGYGLYDMAGNLWEWCWDWYDATYYSWSPSNDPRGPATGSSRVLRGGRWYGGAGRCRAAYRGYDWPGSGPDDLGFRSVLPPGQ